MAMSVSVAGSGIFAGQAIVRRERMQALNGMVRHVATISKTFLRQLSLTLLLITIAVALTGRVHAASPDSELASKIDAATFEVVVPRAVDDPLTYEKPLPLDLLPYQERTDKYQSIGTAFSLGNNRYVTAGHVLMFAIGDLTGAPMLRDASGHVYAIDKIEKFSLQQDFVMFSLKEQPSNAALDVNAKPALNSVVYAVGNALGTGVVIRDGLYTSDTPEDENGRWKWMRFSAAASPGNSGGPLLDEQGRVIGVVLMKSANENLNYALPISEVLNAPDNAAVMDKRMSYQLDVLSNNQNSSFKAQFPLPKTYADFESAYLKLYDSNSDTMLKDLLQSQGDNLFPHGPGSNEILYGSPEQSYFPSLIIFNSSGQWDYAGRELNRVPLSGSGYIATGFVGHNMLVHLRRPDDMKMSAFYNSPKQIMDLVLKTGFFIRPVGPERIKITSMGTPKTDARYVDGWQREWRIYVWDEPFINFQVVMFALPVPDGYAIMMRMNPSIATHDSLIDMKALADFFNVDYGGTLAQWKDFLSDSSLISGPLKGTRIGFDYGKNFSYDANQIAFSYPSSLQTVAPDNMLGVGFGYFTHDGKIEMQTSDVQIRMNVTDPDRINVRRHVAPSPDLDDNFKAAWGKLLHRQHPFDGVAYSDGDEMDIAAVVNPGTTATPTELYTVFYGTQGTHQPDDMKTKLDQLMKSFKIKSN
jgi:serine protease Do